MTEAYSEAFLKALHQVCMIGFVWVWGQLPVPLPGYHWHRYLAPIWYVRLQSWTHRPFLSLRWPAGRP